MLSIENIHMNYEKNKILRGINLEIKKGEIICLLGANGQGKTTLLNIISGISIPTKGRLKINNVYIDENPQCYKSMLGYATDDTKILEYKTLNEYLQFIISIYNCKENIENLKKYVDILKLDEERSKRIEILSKGNRKKVVVVTSILHEPNVLIMDEPIDGLDLDIQIEVINLIKSLKEKMAILIVTHSVSVITELADKVAFLHNGIIKEFDTYDNLMKRYKVTSIYDLYRKVTYDE
ncbi:ABC transporter ATP-binding protein [Clostridium nigeriense]|uniref:ABC transporter ATP-binding protein n=1 Tax=Clostridium nigeriense TaxID=1805470 RepID=UPI003D33806F